MDLSKWISLSYFMGVLKSLHGSVKVVLCISCSLPSKIKLKFDQGFKAFNCCFDLNLFNESKYPTPWVRSAFGNVS